MSDALAAGRRTSPPGPHKKSLLASLALPVNAVNTPHGVNPRIRVKFARNHDFRRDLAKRDTK